MKTYKYNFTPLLKALIVAMIILCLGAAAYNVYNIIRAVLSGTAFSSAWNWFTYAVIIIVGIIGAVVFTAMLINSRYELTETELLLRFGLIVTRYTLSDITAIHVFKNTKKLTIYFKNGNYAVVVVKEEWYKDLIESMTTINPRITYDVDEDDSSDEIK